VATVDHDLPPTTILILENPDLRTPLIQAGSRRFLTRFRAAAVALRISEPSLEK